MADKGEEALLSEVGFPELIVEQNNIRKLLNNMKALLIRVLATTLTSIPSTSAQSGAVKLIQFNPEDADADIKGWCKVTKLIVKSKNLRLLISSLPLRVHLKNVQLAI
ncbi:unnamed protein product [Euphydryas editha]|uniref:Uncharacterized protein n=1 Tax=Euphydryas editha TaxID=104508 RepID=A0AAU9U180_EUPED|nr:unnamed protein product [Euphydryas editha]